MKLLGKKLRAWVFLMWRPLLAFTTVFTVVALVLGFQLGELTGGVSSTEKEYIAQLNSSKALLDNPVFIVHKLPTYLLVKLNIESIAAYRAVSAMFATLAVVSCFFILREWYTDRIAVLGSGLFLTSAWILHIGRLATPESSFLLAMPLLWAAVWLYVTTLRKSAFLVLSLAVASSIYIPGFIWLLVVACIWKRKHIWHELKQVSPRFRALYGVLILLILLPLILASIEDPRLLLSFAGLPAYLPSLKDVLQNLINIPGYLFVRGPNDPTRWLDGLAFLDAFSIAMLILGVYSLRYHMKLHRIQLLGGSTLIICVLIITGGLVSITALMPAIYILIAAGIAFMLQQWFTIFPSNPIARSIATTIMSVTILFVAYYHISHYFIAWPQIPATRTTFSQSLLNLNN